jgi:hypothetical protein
LSAIARRATADGSVRPATTVGRPAFNRLDREKQTIRRSAKAGVCDL